MAGTATGTVKAVALITGDSNVRGSLQFVQDHNGLSLFLSLALSLCGCLI